MFRWFGGARKPDLEIKKDPWAECDGGFYIAGFRKKLDCIAILLAHHGLPSVHTRFNLDTQSAELYDERGLIAQVNVHGDGAPCRVIVASNLSSQGKTLFKNIFPGLFVEFNALIVKAPKKIH